MKIKEDWDTGDNICETYANLFGRKFVFRIYKNGRCHILFIALTSPTAYRFDQKQTRVTGGDATNFLWAAEPRISV